MNKTLTSIFFVIFLIIFSSPLHDDELVSVKIGAIILSPSGDVLAKENGVGTTISMENDLDLDSNIGITAEAALSINDFRLSVGYLPLAFEGNSYLSSDIIFDGTTYLTGDLVNSNVDLDILDVGLTWFLLNFDDIPTRVQLGLEVAVKIVDSQTEIRDDLIRESVSGTLPIPTVGGRARVALSDFIGVNGRVGYMAYSGNKFLDADVQVEFSPIPLVGIYAGYRFLDIAIDDPDLYLDSDFSGFYGGALVRF